MKSFFKSTIIMSFGTLLSRISGFIRDIFIAKYLGSGFYSDIFFMAFRIPNFFRKIFAEGAFNSAFTPIFASGVESHGKEKMLIFARNIYSILLYSLLIFTLLAEIFMPFLMYILAPGYLEEQEKFKLVVFLTRITFPYLIFISLVSLMSGILNTFNKFFVVSIMPVILNFVIISFAIIFRNNIELKIATVLSYAISIAGIVQFIFIFICSLREKILLYPVFPRITPTAKKFLSRFFDSFLASGIMQINSICDSVFASLIPSAVSILYYADRVSQFPLSLIGTAIGITILPSLSRALSKKGDKQEAQELQENSLFLSSFLGIPASFALFFMSNLIVEILFQRGQFTTENTIQVANALKIYSVALPFFIFSKIFQTVFYAKKDTKTPMKNSLLCLGINATLSFSLIFFIGANGIAIATTTSAIFSTFSLFYKILKEKIFIFSDVLQVKLLKVIYISIIMSMVIYSLDSILKSFNTIPLLRLLLLSVIGGSVFFCLSFLLKIINIQEIKKFLRKN